MAEICFVEYIHEILAGDSSSHSTTQIKKLKKKSEKYYSLLI